MDTTHYVELIRQAIEADKVTMRTTDPTNPLLNISDEDIDTLTRDVGRALVNRVVELNRRKQK